MADEPRERHISSADAKRTQAQNTTEAAKGIIDAELEAARNKTDRLLKERLAKEARAPRLRSCVVDFLVKALAVIARAHLQARWRVGRKDCDVSSGRGACQSSAMSRPAPNEAIPGAAVSAKRKRQLKPPMAPPRLSVDQGAGQNSIRELIGISPGFGV